jgi:glutamate synthase domain-containing protein 1
MRGSRRQDPGDQGSAADDDGDLLLRRRPEGARRRGRAGRHTEVLSLGRSLEIIKDIGDAETVSSGYDLEDFTGTHAIGHARMATESDVDIANAHP